VPCAVKAGGHKADAPPPPRAVPLAAKPTFWCQSQSATVTDTAVTAAATCSGTGVPPAAAAAATGLCRLFTTSFIVAGQASCTNGTVGSNGLCSNGAKPTCPVGSFMNPNSVTNATLKSQCVYCPTNTRQMASSAYGPFTCAAACPLGTSMK
jgi:hypothetical protein